MRKYFFLIILSLVASQLQSAVFALKSELKNDTLFFESDAKLEFIIGKTNVVEGSFSFDINKPKDSLHGIIQVDLRTLKTQIATRDKDMREKYLETEKFPYAYFEILGVKNMPEKIFVDSLYSIIGEGNFYLHGVKNRLSPELTIMVQSDALDNQINVTAKFHILLEDYDINRPQLVILKVAKQINLELKFTAFQTETIKNIAIPAIYK